VENAALVGIRGSVHRGDDVGDQGEPLAERGRTLHPLREWLALDPPHHVVGLPVLVSAGVVDRNDRRVFEACGDPDLALEAQPILGAMRERLLDRDLAREQPTSNLPIAVSTS